jgi:hypothetical protein
MTKEELQAELKEKVKPGVKPSRLKRSRSLGDIPKAPPLPKSTPLAKSKSADMIMKQELATTPSSPIEKLEAKISVLELKLEVSQRELTAKENEKQLFADQLKAKQKEIESLRQQLELTPTQNPIQELDQSLIARHQNLKA